MKRKAKLIVYYDFETHIINGKTQVTEWVILYDKSHGILSDYQNPGKTECIINEKYNFIAHIGFDIVDFIKTIEKYTKDTIGYFNNFGGYDGHYLFQPLKKLDYIYSTKPDKLNEDAMFEVEHKNLKKRYKRVQKHLATIEKRPKKKMQEWLSYTWPKEWHMILKEYNIMELIIGLDNVRSNTWKNRIAIFRDSMDIFPMSIKKMGKMLYQQYNDTFYLKKEIEYDLGEHFQGFTNMESYKAQYKTRYEYLIGDAFILFAAHKEFAKILPTKDWKLTAASTTYSKWQNEYGLQKSLKLAHQGVLKGYNFGTTEKPFYQFKKVDNHKKSKWLKPRDIGKKVFEKIFPTKWLNEKLPSNLTVHEALYTWFRAGLAFVNEKYRGKIVSNITKIDINSSYPHKNILEVYFPYGEGITKYEPGYDFKFMTITILKKVKNKKGLPWLAQPNSLTGGKSANYNKTLHPNEKYYLTSMDYEEFLKRYDVKKSDIHVRVNMYFQQTKLCNIFEPYINQWYDIKNKAKQNNNIPFMVVAKIMLNSLWGKFGTKNIRNLKIYLPESDTWLSRDQKIDSKFYLPYAICITSLARMQMVRAVDNNYDKVAYGDTDSLMIKNFSKKAFPNIDIDNEKLGSWKVEESNIKVLIRTTKQYIIFKDNKFYPTVAGINFTRHNQNVDFEDFILGVIINNQLIPKRTPSGVILQNTNKLIYPIWALPKKPEQIRKTVDDFLNYKNENDII